MRIVGFTLVELLVVIAMVALLSAVGLPVYHNYVLRGEVSKATNALLLFVADERDYYNKNGVWATAQALGYGTGTNVDNPSNIYDKFSSITIATINTSCNNMLTRRVEIRGFFDTSLLPGDYLQSGSFIRFTLGEFPDETLEVEYRLYTGTAWDSTLIQPKNPQSKYSQGNFYAAQCS